MRQRVRLVWCVATFLKMLAYCLQELQYKAMLEDSRVIFISLIARVSHASRDQREGKQQW